MYLSFIFSKKESKPSETSGIHINQSQHRKYENLKNAIFHRPQYSIILRMWSNGHTYLFKHSCIDFYVLKYIHNYWVTNIAIAVKYTIFNHSLYFASFLIALLFPYKFLINDTKTGYLFVAFLSTQAVSIGFLCERRFYVSAFTFLIATALSVATCDFYSRKKSQKLNYTRFSAILIILITAEFEMGERETSARSPYLRGSFGRLKMPLITLLKCDAAVKGEFVNFRRGFPKTNPRTVGIRRCAPLRASPRARNA